MPRIFLALNFSVAVTRKIAEEVERLKPAMHEAGYRVAWVPAANLHLTLRFIGSIGEELVEGVTGACGRVAARHQPIEARAVGVGAFPSLTKPNVLWAGVQAPQALSALQREIEAAMVELGFEKEERAFHPHVTVGRVKESGGTAAAELWKSDAAMGSSPLSEIVVYESRTRSAGAEYVARARVPLGNKERG
ncbi:MAG: 2-5 ligase [Myxococcales bacterium]|nr:2-5 ligase [Myxococcales bacterium]